MDKSFVDNVQNNQVIAIQRQIRTALADKVLEALATKKAAIANEMGLKEGLEDRYSEEDRAKLHRHMKTMQKHVIGSDEHTTAKARYTLIKNKYPVKKEDVNVGGSGNPKVGEPADSQDGRTADEKKYLLPEETPPGMEDWVNSNKDKFEKEYGADKGKQVLYATAWKMHNEKK